MFENNVDLNNNSGLQRFSHLHIPTIPYIKIATTNRELGCLMARTRHPPCCALSRTPTTITRVKEVSEKHDPHKFVVNLSQVGLPALVQGL